MQRVATSAEVGALRRAEVGWAASPLMNVEGRWGRAQRQRVGARGSGVSPGTPSKGPRVWKVLLLLVVMDH